MAGFQKFKGMIDYKKIAIGCFNAETDLADPKADLKESNISVTMNYFVFVFSGYSRSLTISPFFPKFRQMPTFSPIS